MQMQKTIKNNMNEKNVLKSSVGLAPAPLFIDLRRLRLTGVLIIVENVS